MAFTYNDPVIFMEYAIDVADACRERGIHPVAVTAGYICDEPRAELYRHMDAANIDLKAFTEEFYKRVAVGQLQPVLDTLRYLRHETDVWFEITNLLIPGHNDTDAELDAMSAWIAEHLGVDVPLHFTAFHPDFKMLDVPPTPAATLTRARTIARRNGLRFVYTGNVHDRTGSSTYCPGCERLVVERDWYQLGAYHLTGDGRCRFCATPVPGPLRRATEWVGCPPPAGVAGHRVTPAADADTPGDRRAAVADTSGAVNRRTRPAAVAGDFYPDDPGGLAGMVSSLIDGVGAASTRQLPPTKAIIAPHAGYQYSGPVAASAYATLAPARGAVRRVVLAGPAHFVPLDGVAVPGADSFATPLGPVTVDDHARRQALDLHGVAVDDRAHAGEHSVEVQLPFLTAVLGEVTVLPLLVGRPGASVLADVLDVLWDGSETRFVISTDLSHYHDADTAASLDGATAEAICRGEAPAPDAACGAAAVAGLLLAAHRRHLDVRLLDLRTSADTAGDPERVVGYGAFALTEPPAGGTGGTSGTEPGPGS